MSISPAAPHFETPDLRRVLARFPSGVAAIAARVDGEDHVIVASSFTVGVSLEPALVMFAVQHSSTTWPVLRSARFLGVSVLSDAQAAVCRQLASRDKATRWNGIERDQRTESAIVLTDAALTFEASIYSTHRAGDHDIVVLQLLSAAAHAEHNALVFHDSQFRRIA